MPFQGEVEPVDEGHRANVQSRVVQLRRSWAVGLQVLRDYFQKDAQHRVERRPIALHEVPQPFGHRQQPLRVSVKMF